MRNLIATFLAFAVLSATAQQVVPSAVVAPPAGCNWQHVQVLPVGTSINVKARSGHASCTLKTVDADSLSCTGKKDVVYQRTDVLSIGMSHRGRSTGIGAAIGGGIGGGIGAATCHNGWQGICAFVLGVPSATAGLLVGLTTDFTRSTVYKAP